MKQILIYILCMVFLCFLIPILFTQKNKVKEVRVDNNIEEKEETKYDYGNYNKVKTKV